MTAPRSVPQVYTHSPAHPNDNEEPLMPRIYVQGRQMALEYASRNFLPFKIAFQGHIACHLLTSLSSTSAANKGCTQLYSDHGS